MFTVLKAFGSRMFSGGALGHRDRWSTGGLGRAGVGGAVQPGDAGGGW